MNKSLEEHLVDSKNWLTGKLTDFRNGEFPFGFIGGSVAAVVLLLLLVGWYWSQEPGSFDVIETSQQLAPQTSDRQVVGSITSATTIHLMDTLLSKSGGYLSNDVTPPSLWLDNIPNWEYGVLVQIRDITRSMRNDFSRSQSQSVEDKDLIVAEPQFNFNSDSWIFPATESEYNDGLKALHRYLTRLQNPNNPEKRLGSLSQRLSASVGQTRVNTDLAGDSAAVQSTATANEVEIKTAWSEIDDVFYEARGAAWALAHLLKAIEHDFDSILRKKNALISLRQIIRELEATQQTLWSPFIMNGSGFGMFANHSLVMASYISRANAAVIDLRQLLQQG